MFSLVIFISFTLFVFLIGGTHNFEGILVYSCLFWAYSSLYLDGAYFVIIVMGLRVFWVVPIKLYQT